MMYKNLLSLALFLIGALLAGNAAEHPNLRDDSGADTVTAAGNSGSYFLPPRMHPADRFMVSLFTDIWQDVPDAMDLKTIQRGISIKAMQDMPIGRTNFSLAAGLGFTSHNLYSDHIYMYNAFEEKHDFYSIVTDYDKNKISLNYLDVPVQFRFRSRGLQRTFRLYAGMKAGYLVNAHTKYAGKAYFPQPGGIQFFPANDDGTFPVERSTKFKEHELENLSSYRIALTAMLGYHRVNLHFSYMLTDIFEGNSAEDMLPVSLGLTFILF